MFETNDDQQLRCEGDLRPKGLDYVLQRVCSLSRIKSNHIVGKKIYYCTRIIHFLALHDEAIYDAGRPQLDW